MSTVLIIVGILVYAGPCALMYLIGKRSGYEQGYMDGRKAGRPDPDWSIPNPGEWFKR